MIDVREDIKKLAKHALLSFIRFRLNDLGIENTWRIGLNDFVIKEYKDHPANYKKLYDFLQTHNEQEVTLEQLDITALSSLVHYYWKGIYEVSTDSTQLFINHVMGIRELRNTFDHYPEDIAEQEREELYYDQLYFSSCIANFAVLVMKYKKPSEEWKLIYHKAKAIESQLQGEHWFAINAVPNSVLKPDEDMSDLFALAEQGQLEAQIRIAKLFYYGQRVKKDRGKAFYWFTKAVEQQSIVASCYLAKFYYPSRDPRSEVDTIRNNICLLLKSYAEQGFAPAQYEYGMMLLHDKYDPEDEKRNYLKWIEKAAEQDHAKALSFLSLQYSYGKNADREKYDNLSLKAANLGEVGVCLAFAKSKLMQGNYDLALHWCNQAKTQDIDEIKEIEATKERIMQKKNEHNSSINQ